MASPVEAARLHPAKSPARLAVRIEKMKARRQVSERSGIVPLQKADHLYGGVSTCCRKPTNDSPQQAVRQVAARLGPSAALLPIPAFPRCVNRSSAGRGDVSH